MRSIPRALLLVALVVCWAPPHRGIATEDQKEPPKSKNQSISCEVCHSSQSPLAKPPYLRPCPRAAMLPEHEPSPEETPEEVTIDNPEGETYEPVVFSHQFHAVIIDGCSSCHHHTSIGDTPPCKTCHGAPFNPEHLEMPGLKGAFHRQCITCHRQNRGEPPSCSECHERTGPGATE